MFPSFSEPQRQEPRIIATTGTSSTFFIGLLHFITGLLRHCSWYTAMGG